MCRDSGAPRGSLGDLAKNRIQKLSATTLAKIAKYFDVSIDYLLGTDNKKSPAPEGAELSKARMKLLAAIDGMSEDEVLAMVQMAEAAKKMRGDGR
jgi:transcriptional regulator with XRE-family HTH domain